MKKQKITIILILIGQLVFGQAECKKAEFKAEKNFSNGLFTFYSLELLPIENTYDYILNEDYGISRIFIGQDSLDFYDCYNSKLTVLLKQKYGKDFLKLAKIKADSLEKTKNWRKDAEFPGGSSALNKLINEKLKVEFHDLEKINKIKVIVSFVIAETGKIEDIKIFRGKNTKVDVKIVKIFKEFPKWNPAYLFGKPIRQKYVYPINIEFK